MTPSSQKCDQFAPTGRCHVYFWQATAKFLLRLAASRLDARVRRPLMQVSAELLPMKHSSCTDLSSSFIDDGQEVSVHTKLESL